MTNDTLLHITAPYKFAGDGLSILYAQTSTIAIVDPFTGEHVGQTVLDFLAQPIYRTLEENTYFGSNGFPILIAVGDTENPETIIGPGVSEGQDSSFISEGVLTYDAKCIDDEACAKRMNAFNAIVDSMKNGESKETSFTRKTQSGEVETLHMVYSPVYITSVRSVNSSDYSRGVSRERIQVYSIALVDTEEGILMPFQQIKAATKRQTNVAIGVLTVVIVAATLSVIYISHRLATSFTEPMIYLLNLIRYINK
jgi:hypothetical protein